MGDATRRRLAAILSADVKGYSRLLSDDETDTIRTLTEYRDEVSKRVELHGGRVVDSPGDNLLAEFPSAVQAVQSAVEIQHALGRRNAQKVAGRRMEFRIGISIGDVVVDGERLYGDGVNIAARLEAMAKGGGICISEDVHRQVESKLEIEYEDLGEQRLKNIDIPVRAFAVVLHGGGEEKDAALLHGHGGQQEIRFCTTTDGVSIGYATAGEGPPLLKAANWLNHLEYDWESPVWRHLLHWLAQDNRLIRYDARGNGLSDRDVEDISFEAFVRDLETVADAAGVERFSLLGISQGCAISVAYAVRHPERVDRLVLYGGYARGRARRGCANERDEALALRTLMREGWGRENAAFRQIFTSRLVPGATVEQMQWFNDLQRVTTSPENAVRIREVLDEIDVESLLPHVRAPTLVVHCRKDAAVPLEEGRRMAKGIPGARLVALEGQNHLILEHERAWPRFMEEVGNFLRDPAPDLDPGRVVEPGREKGEGEGL